MLETIVLTAVGGIGALVIAASLRPDSFSLRRSAHIKAAPETLFALINDLKAFNSWNPFARKDPKMRGSYDGPQAGPGAIFNFRGSGGEGRMEIIGSKPASEVTMHLHMLKPMKAQNLITFTLKPAHEATEIVWSMEGRTPFFAKMLHLVCSVEKMVGRDFENGLANLKSLAEHAS